MCVCLGTPEMRRWPSFRRPFSEPRRTWRKRTPGCSSCWKRSGWWSLGWNRRVCFSLFFFFHSLLFLSLFFPSYFSFFSGVFIRDNNYSKNNNNGLPRRVPLFKRQAPRFSCICVCVWLCVCVCVSLCLCACDYVCVLVVWIFRCRLCVYKSLISAHVMALTRQASREKVDGIFVPEAFFFYAVALEIEFLLGFSGIFRWADVVCHFPSTPAPPPNHCSGVHGLWNPCFDIRIFEVLVFVFSFTIGPAVVRKESHQICFLLQSWLVRWYMVGLFHEGGVDGCKTQKRNEHLVVHITCWQSRDATRLAKCTRAVSEPFLKCGPGPDF